MASGKGQYRRLIGKHTHNFCSRAVKRSSSETQKKILFIASAGADDFMARKLGVQFEKNVFFSAKNKALSKRLNPKSSALALRVYLSALMILLSNDKEMILSKVGLNEADWLSTWCFVFEYGFEDKDIFNSELITRYRSEGVVGLVQVAGRVINESLLLDKIAKDGEFELLRDALIHDAAVIHGVIK